MKDIIIETESMTRFNIAVDTMLEAGQLSSGFVLAHGRAGRGKSVAADRYYYNRGGAYIRVWQNWTQTAFLQRLLFEVRGKNLDMPKHSGTRCKEMIVDILEQENKPIFIDEADRLHIDRIEDLRDIFEMTQVPIILIGEEGIWGLLQSRRRIMSRVAHDVEFKPISPIEVGMFAQEAANLDIEPTLCQKITQHCEGDFRLVRNLLLILEKSARASDNFVVDKEILQNACASTFRRK